MVSTAPTIRALAGFVPVHAIAFGSADSPAVPVDPANPLPTSHVLPIADSVPLVGSSAVSVVAGPFAPSLGRTIWLTLSGSWTGSAQLLRSRDGGTTKLALSYGDGTAKGSFTGNVNAPVAEETVGGTAYYLAITINSGTIAYRLEQ